MADSYGYRSAIVELKSREMVKRIYIVRHGETDFNKQNLIQGRSIDASLNALGHRQAQAFYDYYKHTKFDKVYTSSLHRTHQSMAPLIASGVPHEINAGFDEMDFGVMEGQPMFDEQGRFALEWLLNRWRNNEGDARCDNGESPNDIITRLKVALEAVIANREEENVVICMHGRAIRILLCYLLNEPISRMDQHLHHNLGVSIFDYDYTTGTYTPVALANYDHLEKLSM